MAQNVQAFLLLHTLLQPSTVHCTDTKKFKLYFNETCELISITELFYGSLTFCVT